MTYSISELSHDSVQPNIVKTVTICVPIFNEEDTLPLLFARFNNLIEPIGYKFNYLFIDDGSYDSSRKIIKDYVGHNPNSGYIFLSRNFGKESAMMTAVDYVDTDAMVIVDADLQDPPELIPKMIDLWSRGYDDVYARRSSRNGDGWFKRITAKYYYKILQSFTNINIQQDTGDFRLIDRNCILALRGMREYNRNTKALFSWIGFRKTELRYDRGKRSSGKSKWTIPKLVRLAIDGITSFSVAPLRISTYIGLLSSLTAIAYALFIVVKTIISGVDVPGYASLIVVILFMGGLQFLALGIIGEYLGRIFTEVKKRPSYLIQDSNINYDTNKLNYEDKYKK